jgi:hypothetical protein
LGWARWLLLGDLGQQLDLGDAHNALERLRRSSSSASFRAIQNDEQIRELADRNEQLTLCLIMLVRLMIAKGAIVPAEVQELLAVLDPPPPSPESPDVAQPEPTTDDLIALAEAARRLRTY